MIQPYVKAIENMGLGYFGKVLPVVLISTLIQPDNMEDKKKFKLCTDVICHSSHPLKYVKSPVPTTSYYGNYGMKNRIEIIIFVFKGIWP